MSYRGALLIVAEAARRQRERDTIRSIVLEAFEPDPKGRAKRSEVYRYVGQRLQRPVSNELCILVRDSLAEMDDVMLSVSDGRARFYGLRKKESSSDSLTRMGSEYSSGS